MADEPLNASFDVLGLGIVTVDDLLYVEHYPPPDAKVPVRRRLRQCGGLTGTALVAAARLGARCAFAGILADDELSDFIRWTFLHEGIDLSHEHPNAARRPIHSTIIVDETTRTRTIFFERDPSRYDGHDWPPESLIRSSKVLFLDHDYLRARHPGRPAARDAGVPIVADYERDEAPDFAELLGLTDHLIVSRDFAARLTGVSDPKEAVVRLWSARRAVAVVTDGEAGCWWVDAANPNEPRYQPAFPVAVVDTTGCGDVFHGAYASALARGLALPDRLQFASAAAAIKATQAGGQAGIPTRIEVAEFSRRHEA